MNKKGKENGIVTFLAVLGVIFLIWLGYSSGTALCKNGVTCNLQEKQDDIKRNETLTKNDTPNIQMVISKPSAIPLK